MRYAVCRTEGSLREPRGCVRWRSTADHSPAGTRVRTLAGTGGQRLMAPRSGRERASTSSKMCTSTWCSIGVDDTAPRGRHRQGPRGLRRWAPRCLRGRAPSSAQKQAPRRRGGIRIAARATRMHALASATDHPPDERSGAGAGGYRGVTPAVAAGGGRKRAPRGRHRQAPRGLRW